MIRRTHSEEHACREDRDGDAGPAPALFHEDQQDKTDHKRGGSCDEVEVSPWGSRSCRCASFLPDRGCSSRPPSRAAPSAAGTAPVFRPSGHACAPNGMPRLNERQCPSRPILSAPMRRASPRVPTPRLGRRDGCDSIAAHLGLRIAVMGERCDVVRARRVDCEDRVRPRLVPAELRTPRR